MNSLNKLVTVNVLVCILFTASVLSETNTTLLNNRNVANKVSSATKLLKQKSYAKACSQLMDLSELASKVDSSQSKEAQLQLNINYLLGQCHAGLALFKEASVYFERVVQYDPSEPRPYLDLALTYQYLGEYSLADSKYSELLDMPNLSDTVRQKVEHLYSNNPNKIQYFIDFSTGVISDDNINNAPITDSITMWDTEFIFNNDSRPKSDLGIYLGANAKANKLLSSQSRLTSTLEINSTNFTTDSEHNNAVIDFGVTYHRKLWGGEYSVQTRLANVSIGNESLLNVFGVNGIYSIIPFNKLRTTAKLGIQTLSYTESSDRNVNELNTGFLVNYQVSNKWLLNSEVGFAYGAASDDANSYTNYKFDFGGNYSITNSLLLSMTLRYNPRKYLSKMEAFNKTRDDQRTLINTELNYNFKDNISQRLTLDLGVNLFQNKSNIKVFENDRTQAYLILHFTI